MRLLRTAVPLLLAAALAAIVPIASPPASAVTHWAMGYYPVYERDQMPLDEIEWGNMTHIAIGAALPGRTGGLNLSFYLGSQAEGIAFAKDVATTARTNGVKSVLMVGGAGMYGRFVSAASSAHRATFVKHIVAARRRLGVDGVDIDWEPLAKKDLGSLNALLVALRRADPTSFLTLPLTPTGLNDPAMPAVYARIASHLAQLNLMTYGMEGDYPGWQSWHSSALAGATTSTPLDVETAVANLEDTGVPPSKIGLGVGFYGQCWTGVTGPGQDITGADIVDGELGYRDIATSYYGQPGTTYTLDGRAQAPYIHSTTAFGPENCTYLTYEDTPSIQAKGAWAQTQGLGGAIVWSIPKAHFSGDAHPDALLGIVKDSFGA